MKTLLVPLDFSESTQAVLDHAAALARILPARLIVLHVTEPVATYIPVGASMDVLSATPPPLAVENTDAQQEKVARIVEPLKATGLEVEAVASLGLAVDEILDQASQYGADYIVLGSHGHGALYHLFSGSVVNGVLKNARCPVLVVPQPRK